jgi:protein-tyrosine kinase
LDRGRGENYVLSVLKRQTHKKSKKRVAQDQLRANQIKMIRTRLQKRIEAKHLSILVTTADKSFNHSLISYELALAFAEQGKKTVLVDANLKEPILHKWFEEVMPFGLVNALQRGDIARYVQQTKIKNLSFVSYGTSTKEALESWRIDKLEALMKVLRLQNEVIIIESPSYLAYSETQMLGELVDEVVVIVKQHKDKIGQLRQLKNDLESNGKEISGMIYQSH